MPITVLFDLDDTLLSNDIDRFLPAYLKMLGKYLASRFPAGTLIAELLTATQKMASNQNPCKTLETVFNEAFYPALGTTYAELQEPIETFYREVFPGLQYLTAPRPEAVTLVETALAAGHRVVIATNPLFPRAAIEHRLAWAGLPPKDYPFALVTSYEDLHFAKPTIAYYAEILAQLGWADQPAVMVGNSLKDDLEPAAQLGMPTFWVNGSSANRETLQSTQAQGSLSDVFAWLSWVDQKRIMTQPATPESMTAVLRSTPAALQTLVSQMQPSCWSTPPRPGEWNLTEIFCHLRDVDREVNLARIHKVMQEENPFLPGIDSDPWAEQRQYARQNGHQAFAEFIQARLDLLAQIDQIEPAGWQRTARHAIFGPTRLVELAGFIVTHDRTHFQQILQNLRA